MTVKDQLKPILEKLINQVKLQTQSAKSIALDQAWKILQLVLAQLVQAIEEIGKELSGPDKKAVVLDLLSGFYDKVFLVIDIPFVPNFIEPIIHKHVKSLLMILAGSSIDALVTTFRNVGVFIDPKNKVDPSHDSQPKISEK
jgi:ABC-type lipopolysaccharide export system ATPase subunit